jgi:hypothetical protein
MSSLVMFRKSLRDLLGRLISAKWRDVEAQFETVSDKLAESTEIFIEERKRSPGDDAPSAQRRAMDWVESLRRRGEELAEEGSPIGVDLDLTIGLVSLGPDQSLIEAVRAIDGWLTNAGDLLGAGRRSGLELLLWLAERKGLEWISVLEAYKSLISLASTSSNPHYSDEEKRQFGLKFQALANQFVTTVYSQIREDVTIVADSYERTAEAIAEEVYLNQETDRLLGK